MAERSLLGFEQVMAELNRRLAAIGRVSAQALIDVGLDLWGEANKTAPKDTGDLRASAYLRFDGRRIASGEQPPFVTVSDSTGGALSVSDRHEVRFGYGVPYALRLHEMPEYKNPTTPGTGPKWLERALTQNLDRYLRYIANRTREEVERRGS